MCWCVCVRYVTVLVELTRIEGTKHGRLIAAQLLDVAIRVQAVRAFVVVRMVTVSVLMAAAAAAAAVINISVFIIHHFSRISVVMEWLTATCAVIYI